MTIIPETVKRFFMFNKRFFTLALILGSCLSMMAQDIHFSQFYMSPLNLNPALTGVNNCKTRLVANYRNQWASVIGSDAYNTYSVSYDQKVAVGRSDYFGIGGTLWGDVAGETRFGSSQARMSFSYSKKVGGYRKAAKYLVVGADAGVTQRRVRDGDFRWGTQHDGNGGFNGSLSSGEPVLDPDFLYADVSVGILFFNVTDERNNWYVGAALAHVNQPNISFYQGDDAVTLYTKNTFHAGAQLELTRDISILPAAVLFFQGKQREYNLGTSFRFDTGTRSVPQSWQVGAWFRAGTQATVIDQITQEESGGGFHADAIILSTRFNYDKFGIGFSYDSTISDLRQGGNAVGSFEFSLNYFICGPEKRAVYCPRF